MEKVLTNIVLGGIVLLVAIFIYAIYVVLTDDSPHKN